MIGDKHCSESSKALSVEGRCENRKCAHRTALTHTTVKQTNHQGFLDVHF